MTGDEGGDVLGDEPGKASEATTVVLVSPAMREANNGNWHTAHRWGKFLSGHCDITLTKRWSPDQDSPAAAAMIALHARRSAASIQAWARHRPGRPLVLVLTGTDLYRDIHEDADARQSLALATHVVVLQQAGLREVPAEWRHKARVIYQSAPALKPATKSTRLFHAVMVGHLRDEKDPLTWLRAVASCPDEHMRFEQIGDALQPHLADAVLAAQASLPRFRWSGGLPQAQTRQHIKRAHVLVVCSIMEGGAQVILEAVQSGTAVLASHISGNIGMLGDDYRGYFAVGNDAALAGLMQRCATDPAFLRLLENQCAQRAHLFRPAEEKRLVINLLQNALKDCDERA